ELSKKLHDDITVELGSEEMPSTTFSGLVGKVTTSKDFVTFHPEESYQLSLSGLNSSASRAIAQLDLGSYLEFLGTRFQISERQNDTTSYETLYHTYVANEPEPTRQFELQFLTPTAFSQNRLYLPLPVPTLMFRSWLERWNHFAPVYLGSDDLIGYLGSAVPLTRHRIQTQSFQVYKNRITGFSGDVTLKVLTKADSLLANITELLVHYSMFSSTGVKTRLGMGHTKNSNA
ncbi:MAG: CRISPR system precrRNA processing endoribonuclease RAMP protein Cas6, partial [Kangiellaceae bacterium]|nr:CRISPR system precrRNA processing endoribonuclease RAMP protein Cas6 [Kangiellaceae bacterium]